MTRLPIYRGMKKDARVFRSREGRFSFSVRSADWELYLEKFFKSEDRWYTEHEWSSIMEAITEEKTMLSHLWENMTGLSWTGESYREMVYFDSEDEKEAAEWTGSADALYGIIVFYERFLLFSGSIMSPKKLDLVESKAA